MEAKYEKLMGQDDEPSSPTSEITKEDIIDQPPPPGCGRDFCWFFVGDDDDDVGEEVDKYFVTWIFDNNKNSTRGIT
uniref:Uncharacterized protein n=1 Tax=Tanacetum cinerariifolium TaxID=118510 RepID=A0A6L2LWK6_TANCI|nr:hypothetical protein [Tanacetum cinerariifolium]